MSQQQSKQRAQNPRERRVEDEAWLARIEGRCERPVWMQVAVAELARGLHPVQQMEVEVVAAGAAVMDERHAPRPAPASGISNRCVVRAASGVLSRRSSRREVSV